MKAYHIKTMERDPYDFMGFEQYELNSIFIPDKQALAGYIPWKDNKGIIINYSKVHNNNAQDIVDGNKNGIKGIVISELDVSEDIADKIFRTKHESQIKVIKQYDGTTSTLVGILSGELIQKSFLEKIIEKYKKNKL